MIKRTYAAAQNNRLTNAWKAGDTSADQEVYNSIVTVRSRANALYRDSGLVRASVRAIVEEVLGTGLTLKPMVKRGRKRGSDSRYMDATNELITQWWREWIRKENFDVAGFLNLHRGAQQALANVIVTGEAITRFIYQPFGNSDVPLALEFVQPERLDHTKNGQVRGKGNVTMGVEKDDWGRPINYGFTTRHPNPLWTTWQQIGPTEWLPANEILHIYQADRPGQTRGIGDLCALINQTYHLHEYQSNEVSRQRAASSLLGFILRDIDYQPPDEEKNNSFDIEPVSYRELEPGERVEMPHIPPSDPSAPLFLRDQRKNFTSGLGAPYERSTGDYGETNFSRAKLALIDREPHIHNLRAFMIESYYEPIVRKWLDRAYTAGMNMPGFAESRPRYFDGMSWRAAGRPLAEPAKELPALLDGVERGSHTLQDVLDHVHGDRTVEEQFDMRQEEIKMAAKHGLNFTPASEPTYNEPLTTDSEEDGN